MFMVASPTCFLDDRIAMEESWLSGRDSSLCRFLGLASNSNTACSEGVGSCEEEEIA